MHDFIQISDFTYHYFLLTILGFISIVSIIVIMWSFINKQYNELEIPCIMIGSTLIILSCILISAVNKPYAEYTGMFKVTDLTTDRIYQKDEPKIIIQDKYKNEQKLPITENEVFHKGDIVKIKVRVNKGFKPSLKKEMPKYSFNDIVSMKSNQSLISIKKVN